MTKNYFYNLLISLVNILFPIITFRYAAGILGPSGIGKVQFAITFAEYFALFAALGIPAYGISAIARIKADTSNLSKVFSELVSIHAIAGVLISCIYFTCIYSIPYFKTDLPLYSFAGLIVLFGFTSVDWFYSGIEKFKLIALRSVLIKLISVLLLFILVKTRNDFLHYLWVLLFTMLGNNLISLIFIGRHTKPVFKGLRIRKHIKPVLFILASSIAVNLYALWDTIILNFLTNFRSVGLYVAAIKLVKFAIPLITSMGAGLIPKIAQNIQLNNHAESNKLLQQSFHFIVFLAVPVSAGIFLLAPEFILIFSGHEFSGAVNTMRILSVLPILVGLGNFFGWQIMVPAGLNKQLLYATAIAAVFSIGLNFLLIPYFNIIGAGIANVTAELVVTAVFYFFVIRNYSIIIRWNLFLKALLCTVIFIPIIYAIRWAVGEPLAILLFSVGVCGLIYFLTQHFLFRDKMINEVLGVIKKALSRRPVSINP